MKDPAFLFYSSDFLTGTMFLSDEQVGKFIRLLCAQHQKGRLSEKHMLSICKAYDSDIYEMFLKDEEGLFYNERLEAEATKRTAFTESRRNNAKGSKKNNKQPKAYAKHMPKHMENENENENRDINTVINEIEIYPTFKDFYDLYDKKIGNKSAMEKKFNKLPQKVKEKIIDYLPEYIQSTPDKTYRKNPQTFLNNKSWEDEIIYKTNEDGNKNQYANLERLIEANNI